MGSSDGEEAAERVLAEEVAFLIFSFLSKVVCGSLAIPLYLNCLSGSVRLMSIKICLLQIYLYTMHHKK